MHTVVKLNSIEDIKKLVNLAGDNPSPVFAGNDHVSINAASLLGALSLDLNRPIQLEYEKTSTALDKFVEAHPVD